MKLSVKPADGWGFYYPEGGGSIPPAFELEVQIEEAEAGSPFQRALGQVKDQSHAFAGCWVRLSPRHTVFDRWCNMDVFRTRPAFPVANAELVASGMAVIEIRPNS